MEAKLEENAQGSLKPKKFSDRKNPATPAVLLSPVSQLGDTMDGMLGSTLFGKLNISHIPLWVLSN